MSPTARTLATLRALGWTAAVTERWNPHARIRQDLFGFCDVMAIRGDWPPGDGFLAVQCTTGDHVADRLSKIRDLPAVRTWIEAGGRIEVWGWSKRGPRGARKVWTVRRVLLAISGGRVVDVSLSEDQG